MESSFENNVIKMGGVVASELELSHEIYGEKFYKVLQSPRRRKEYILCTI